MRNGRILVDTHSIQAVSGEWMEGRAGLMEGRDLLRYVRGWVVDRYCGCAGLSSSGEVWTFFPPSVVGQHHPSRVTKQFISSTPCFICPRSASFAMAALPRFERLNISYDRDVWGPSKEGARFAAVPYASFKKSDMIGKAVDFTLDRDYQERRRDRDNRHRRGPQESNETFDYKHDHRDEKSFNLVDTSKAKKQSRLGNGRNQRDKQGWRHLRDRDVRNEERKKQSQQANDTRNRRYLRLMQAKRNSQRRRNWNSMDEVEAESSVAVDVSWKVVETFEFHKFEKLSKLPPKEEDLCWCGHLEYYEETYDRVQSKRPTPLKIIEDREFYYESTLNDPVIEELAESSGGKVFATDAILAITTPVSVRSPKRLTTLRPGSVLGAVLRTTCRLRRRGEKDRRRRAARSHQGLHGNASPGRLLHRTARRCHWNSRRRCADPNLAKESRPTPLRATVQDPSGKRSLV